MQPRSSHPSVRYAATLVSSLAFSFVPAVAQAQQPSAPLPPPPPPADAPLSPESGAREDALTVPGGYTCVVGEHAGVERDDVRTAADVLCHALSAHHARPGVYDIRLGKLGAKVLLVLMERATNDERRLFIQGVEELPVASERVVTALVENKSLEQTETVDNVVSSESTTPKQKKVQAGVILGLTGQSAVGTPNTTSGGVEIDMQFRLKNLAILGQARAGGIGSADNELGYASLGLGARYFLGDGDVAPFIGAGFMFAYLQANQGNAADYDGSGFGGYGELGLAFWRTSRVGGVVNLRADLPFFSMKQSSTNDLMSLPSATMYLVPLSFNVGVSFQ